MKRILFICGLLFGLPAMAQTGGSFDLSRSLIAGGGGESTAGDIAERASVGQAVTLLSSGGAFTLHSGFWPQFGGAPPPTPSPTSTGLPITPTATLPPASSATPTPTSTPTATSTWTPTTTVATVTPSATTGTIAPATPSLTPTPTATPQACTGDCDGDGAVTVDEIVLMVNIALDGDGLAGCPSADFDGDGQVSVDEIIVAVDNALDGCAQTEDV